MRKRCVQSSAWRRVSAKTIGTPGVANLEAGDLVGEPVPVEVLLFEVRAVAGLDDDRGERELGEPLQLEGEAAVGQR